MGGRSFGWMGGAGGTMDGIVSSMGSGATVISDCFDVPEMSYRCIERFGHPLCAGSSKMASTTISQIMWPRPAVADCIFCMIVRDTRGAVLDHDQRFNFFPASPLCSLTSVFAGEWHLIDRPDQMDHPWSGVRLPGLAFAGAQLRPPVSWNPG